MQLLLSKELYVNFKTRIKLLRNNGSKFYQNQRWECKPVSIEILKFYIKNGKFLKYGKILFPQNII
jgi:hypothetical protein